MGKRQTVVIQLLTTLAPRVTIRTGALLVYINALRTRLFGLGSVHSFFDIRCKAVERLLNVDVVLGRDLEEGNAEFIGELLALFSRNRPFLLPVAFISNEDLVYAFTSMLFDV